MITLRRSTERGNSQFEWLNSFHTFSFAEYYDPKFMGFGPLRVINEDTIQPGTGFGRHGHQDMEIISYVIEGALEHGDSMGTGSVIRPGEIQKMSAGSGIEHSEFNHSNEDPLHFLQIWIIPKTKGLQPSYEQKTIVKQENQWILMGSPDGGDEQITIHQDVRLFSAYLSQNHTIQYEFENGRYGWLQLVRGKICLNDQILSAGDGASIMEEKQIQVQCLENSELLLFDLK